ncbi:MAG: hypothetical protein Ct9H300mP13_4890 [Gammaproteobacteria bacterium]|nr:MAG: hypothetical protein Ct9H300mP13_4890 [Gammaproteobacteria bacterium]
MGMDALDNVGVWDKIYRMQLASHGMGYASTMALSGLDLALWDIKGQALNRPLFEILGGSRKKYPRTRVVSRWGGKTSGAGGGSHGASGPRIQSH